MNRNYTQSGDDGFTGLLGEGRVPKNHPRIEAVGCLDEATAALGVARAACLDERSIAMISSVQRDIYHLMAEIAATPDNAARFRVIDAEKVSWLEEQIEGLARLAPPPKGFTLPGDSSAGAVLALARTIVRRAERRVAELFHSGLIENKELLRYLNRLSSLCFALELLENQVSGKTEPTLAKGDPNS